MALCNMRAIPNKLLQHPGIGKEDTVRVPTQIVFSNSLCFPCVFPVRPQIFPVPIYMICEYYIHRTDLADLYSLLKKMDFFATTMAISFTFRIRTFTT